MDEGLEKTWYQDTDRDGYGDTATATTACAAPPGTVEQPGDCNDADAAWYPGAPEDCSVPEDRNCDGSVQYADADGDGVAACLDCDDTNALAYPGAVEVCDPDNVDEDCSGAADDADPNVDPATQVTTWTDTDGDGYGDDATVVTSCDGVGASSGGDCNDADVAYYPGAPETDCADPADYNCDGSSGYSDNDSDSFFACQECNDGDAAINPAATEICDTVDNNCDGTVDEGLTSTFYADVDGDGFGDSSAPMDACAAPWVM